MKNVFEERIDKELYIILSNSKEEQIGQDVIKNTAIFIYLYYDSSIKKYLNYISNIPNDIDTFIISSKESLLTQLKNICSSRTNLFFVKKPNVGRDVSALLVTCKNDIMRYKYFCFVHDKNEKFRDQKELISSWVENLWVNTLENDIFIKNVIYYFETHSNLGILAPIEPIERYSMDFWCANYENTVELAHKLKLEAANLSKSYQPVTLGTCFWARTEALEKLFSYDWKYSDFVLEPMPDDGTISHAVERIFPYVSQNAGYQTGTVINQSYAPKLIAELYENWFEMGAFVRKKFGIASLEELKRYKTECMDNGILDYCKRYKNIYIYGAGRKARDSKHYFDSLGIKICGFLVTDISAQKDDNIEELQVIQVDKCKLNEAGIIVATNKDYWNEISDYLRALNYTDAFFWEL